MPTQDYYQLALGSRAPSPHGLRGGPNKHHVRKQLPPPGCVRSKGGHGAGAFKKKWTPTSQRASRPRTPVLDAMLLFPTDAGASSSDSTHELEDREDFAASWARGGGSGSSAASLLQQLHRPTGAIATASNTTTTITTANTTTTLLFLSPDSPPSSDFSADSPDAPAAEEADPAHHYSYLHDAGGASPGLRALDHEIGTCFDRIVSYPPGVPPPFPSLVCGAGANRHGAHPSSSPLPPPFLCAGITLGLAGRHVVGRREP